jgi:hypothetical protein
MTPTPGNSDSPPAIWALTVKLVCNMHTEEPWEAVIEISPFDTLDDLHYAIQDAVEFDDDHLYEFFVARGRRSRNRVRFTEENYGLDESIGDAYPDIKNYKLFYLFDYGDDWLFEVSKGRRKPRLAEEGVEYPRMVSESGKKPEQYPDEEW